jgi:ribonuclease HI
LVKDLSKEESIRIMVTLWAFWHARRNIVHEGNYHSPLLTHCFIERFIGDLKQLDHTPVSNLVVLPRGPRWIAPPQGLAKINVGSALSKTSPKGAIAAVARSSEGSFLGASSLVINGVMDPETMEALACREELNLALDLLLMRIRVASDCQNLIRKLGGEWKGLYGHIIMELKARFAHFETIQFVHEGRSANIDAHTLGERVYISRARPARVL